MIHICGEIVCVQPIIYDYCAKKDRFEVTIFNKKSTENQRIVSYRLCFRVKWSHGTT